MLTRIPVYLLIAAVSMMSSAPLFAKKRSSKPGASCEKNEWTEINPDAPWAARSGLRSISLGGCFYVMGGRTAINPEVSPVPGASQIWSDVWCSKDLGVSWEQLLPSGSPDHWSPRAFFDAVKLGGHMYVLGGQDFNVIPNPFPVPGAPPFISLSNFFSDVWCSRDGVHWELRTADAGWTGRAGLSAVAHRGALYVMGGSFNDDPAVIGGPPTRVYFNDVWCSRDKGKTWKQVAASAPWAPRAGAVTVSKNGKIYLIGGEDGFTCGSGGDRCPPYFNDVWSSRDGVNWKQVTEAAEWAPRPGHQVAVVRDHFYLFGGFGLSTDPGDPFKPSNPVDVWTSKWGKNWKKVNDSPWDATDPSGGRYDFDVVVGPGPGGCGPSIYTFGGSRETFNFADPLNYLNLENDVWRYTPPVPARDKASRPLRRPPARPAWPKLFPWQWVPGPRR